MRRALLVLGHVDEEGFVFDILKWCLCFLSPKFSFLSVCFGSLGRQSLSLSLSLLGYLVCLVGGGIEV